MTCKWLNLMWRTESEPWKSKLKKRLYIKMTYLQMKRQYSLLRWAAEWLSRCKFDGWPKKWWASQAFPVTLGDAVGMEADQCVIPWRCANPCSNHWYPWKVVSVPQGLEASFCGFPGSMGWFPNMVVRGHEKKQVLHWSTESDSSERDAPNSYLEFLFFSETYSSPILGDIALENSKPRRHNIPPNSRIILDSSLFLISHMWLISTYS